MTSDIDEWLMKPRDRAQKQPEPDDSEKSNDSFEHDLTPLWNEISGACQTPINPAYSRLHFGKGYHSFFPPPTPRSLTLLQIARRTTLGSYLPEENDLWMRELPSSFLPLPNYGSAIFDREEESKGNFQSF
jgi:hypothetical protein